MSGVTSSAPATGSSMVRSKSGANTGRCRSRTKRTRAPRRTRPRRTCRARPSDRGGRGRRGAPAAGGSRPSEAPRHPDRAPQRSPPPGSTCRPRARPRCRRGRASRPRRAGDARRELGRRHPASRSSSSADASAAVRGPSLVDRPVRPVAVPRRARVELVAREEVPRRRAAGRCATSSSRGSLATTAARRVRGCASGGRASCAADRGTPGTARRPGGTTSARWASGIAALSPSRIRREVAPERPVVRRVDRVVGADRQEHEVGRLGDRLVEVGRSAMSRVVAPFSADGAPRDAASGVAVGARARGGRAAPHPASRRPRPPRSNRRARAGGAGPARVRLPATAGPRPGSRGTSRCSTPACTSTCGPRTARIARLIRRYRGSSTARV